MKNTALPPRFARSATSPLTSDTSTYESQGRSDHRRDPDRVVQDAAHRPQAQSRPSIPDLREGDREPSTDYLPRARYGEARVTRTYQAENPDDLSLEIGQIIRVLREENRRWFYGVYVTPSGNERRGIFPKSHVVFLGNSPTASHTLQSQPELLRRAYTTPIQSTTPCHPDCTLRQVAKVHLDPPPLKPISVAADRTSWDTISRTMSSIFSDLKPWQTRLIKLKPARETSRLECDMLVVDLIAGKGCAVAGSEQIVEYTALSYSWASDEPTARITINGLIGAIAVELANALLYLRSSENDKYIWCDALCINQKNPGEKAAQIRSMLRIFEKAENVTAWLGVPHSSSSRLVKAFELISPEHDLLEQNHDTSCREALEGLRISLRFHLSSHWFLRTWVRQEVFAARNLTLCLGGRYLKFETFTSKFNAIYTLCDPEPGGRLTMPIEKPKTLDVLQREYQHFGIDRYDFRAPNKRKEFSEHWLDVLSQGPLFGVSEQRDRIYGSLGILTSSVVGKAFTRLPGEIEELVKKFPVSYNKDKQLGEVFGDVTKFLINVTRTANVLDFWRIPRKGRESCPGLTSWATDWRFFDGVVLPSAISCGYPYERTGFTDQPQQQYHCDAPLGLQGVRLTTGSHQIRSLTEGFDGFNRYQSALSSQVLDSLGQGPVDGVEALTVWFEANDEQIIMHEMPFDLEDSSQIVDGIRKGDYCLVGAHGPLEAETNVGSFLVSRNAQLDDVIVSFYGSHYLHLIRLCDGVKSTYQYLGPALPLVLQQLPSAFSHTRAQARERRELTISRFGADEFESQVFNLI